MGIAIFVEMCIGRWDGMVRHICSVVIGGVIIRGRLCIKRMDEMPLQCTVILLGAFEPKPGTISCELN